MMKHLWFGKRISDDALKVDLRSFGKIVAQTLSRRFELDQVIEQCDAWSALMEKDKVWNDYIAQLHAVDELQKAALRVEWLEIAEFLKKDNLLTKIRREFGKASPFDFRRALWDDVVYENFQPLGALFHFGPGNSLGTNVLTVVEGLLTGNINLLKPSDMFLNVVRTFFEVWLNNDLSGELQKRICVLGIDTKQEDLVRSCLAEVQGVVFWGGTEGARNVRAMIPQGVRWIEWGHRISFAYVSRQSLATSNWVTRFVEDICFYQQLSCSSPQVLYLEDASDVEMNLVAQQILEALRQRDSKQGEIPLSVAAEIKRLQILLEAESFLPHKKTDALENEWGRVLIDDTSELRTSPLYQTVWLKKISRKNLYEILQPHREYLQTVGLECGRHEATELVHRLFATGATRVRRFGEMAQSYTGEPHDGVMSLRRYTRVVSAQLSHEFFNVASLSEFEETGLLAPKNLQIMNKEMFQDRRVDDQHAELFFRSGGSSGEPKLSVFTYEDYSEQMQRAADGLVAAGLCPNKDICLNMFFAGELYGGFLSFFSILEHLKIPQFPMAATPDFALVEDMIRKFKINTILGMPSYLLRMFHEREAFFRNEKLIRKVFYGGEPITAVQSDWLKGLGIQTLKSAAYGSVDMGPLGYQCEFTNFGVHHLHHRIHALEILQMGIDHPVEDTAIGRLVFSTWRRSGQNLLRYDVGDLGRWVPGVCPCGRTAPKFELIGRQGDVFRASGTFFNYSAIGKKLNEFNIQNDYQVVLQQKKDVDEMHICVGSDDQIDIELLRSKFLESLQGLKDLVIHEKTLRFMIDVVSPKDLRKAKGSGKLLHVIDERGH